MKFRFRLEPVLRLREHRLDRCRHDLAAAVERLAEVEREERAIAAALQAAQDALGRRIQAGVDGGSLAASLDAVDGLRGRYRACARARIDAEHGIGEARSRVAEGHRDVRVLEKLREREREAFRREADRVAQQRLEEAARLAVAQGSEESRR